MPEHHAVAADAPPPLADDDLPSSVSRTDPAAFAASARAFVEAFNRRDADALVGLAHPSIVLRPTALVGRRTIYHGHDGLRRWIAELDAQPLDVELLIREIRPQRPNGFLVLARLRVGDELVEAAMIASLHEGEIVEAHGYLSEEWMLVRLGLISDASPSGQAR